MNGKDTIAEEVSDVTITLAEEASEAVREKVDAEEILRNKDSGQEQKERDLVLQCQTPLLSDLSICTTSSYYEFIGI